MSDTIITELDVLNFMRTLDRNTVNPHADEDSCIYTEEDGAPSCIVGRVLAYFELPRPNFDDVHNSMAADKLFFGGNFKGGVHVPGSEYDALTDPAKHLLVWTQTRADDGYTWGEAIDGAAVQQGLVSPE